MQERKSGFTTWIGMLAAASGIMAPSAFAVGWCPNVRDYNIACSNCSRELTCDVGNTSIWITGTNVTLDGQGHAISYSPGAGIKVYAPNSTIRNVNIHEAGQGTSTTEGHGIYYSHSGNGSWSYVNNVFVYHSKTHGIYNASGSSVRVDNSAMIYNGGTGVVAAGASGRYTDMYNSSSNTNNAHGYHTVTPWSYVIGDGFYSNGSYGMYAYGLPGLLIQGNNFYGNYRGLFLSSVSAPQVQNNSGGSNTVIDCFDINSTNGVHSGNSWGTASGTNCTP